MSNGMAVIANNIANANSKGFKFDRAEFDDLLAQDMNGSQIGRGARLAQVKTIHTQGGLAVTDRLTDLAIQGKGFFVVKNLVSETQEAGGMFYTRLGSFNFDQDGYLADANGGHVQGYEADQDGNLSSKLGDIRIISANLPPIATTKVTFNVNLDSRAEVMEETFDINNAEKTSNFNNTVNIFDSHGNSHAMTTYFRRIEDGEGISFEWFATVAGKEIADPDGETQQIGRGIVRFDSKGNLIAEETIESNANFAKGANPNQIIDFDFGKNLLTEAGNGVGSSTATASASQTFFHNQNGYQAGNLKSLKIDLDGKIKGHYTNGIQKTLGAVALASFENQDGLQKAGRNQFFSTLESGSPRIGTAQTGVRGSIYASSLEESNVDLAGQFVNMIMTQRGFQANSRSITTTDTMIEEVVNMKR
jgi:flagellar hook protein FlgE